MQNFISTFQKYIKSEDVIVLAVSGGMDSMVLFDLVIQTHPQENIVVVHFDHSLRGIESDEDREFVASICKSKNITFEVKKMDIGSMARIEKMNLEAIARRERYTFLEKIRKQHGANYIFTAHHAADQTETIIGNILKGAKLRGLSGMSCISGNIFRPLLSISKNEIRKYSQEHTIEYREDSSNSDIAYDRNRIRQDIIPVFELLNPSVHYTIGELTEYMQDLTSYLKNQVEIWLQNAIQESGKSNTFLISSFVSLDVFFQSEIISYLYVRAHIGSSQGLSRGLIDELIRFVQDRGSYGKKEIKNLYLERRGNKIFY